MEKRDGNEITIRIAPDGIAETSDTLDIIAWGKDEYYYSDGKTESEIPVQFMEDWQWKSQVHRVTRSHMRFDSILVRLPSVAETTLFEGSEVVMADSVSNITKGRPVLLHFFVSGKAETVDFQVPELPKRREFWESRFRGE